MFEPQPLSLSPVNFFALACDCHQLAKRDVPPSFTTHLVPASHALTQEEAFAKVAMGWHEEGIALQFQVNRPANRSFYPEIEQGDSIECFFDTRDVKTSGFNTRFCHHFFFLPHSIEGVTKGEKTHFRSEDSHPLCDAQELECSVQLKKKEYVMNMFIPVQCLVGYDPKQFDRLGFTYRINRFGGEPQHFSVLTQEYQIDQQPALWASLKLTP